MSLDNNYEREFSIRFGNYMFDIEWINHYGCGPATKELVIVRHWMMDDLRLVTVADPFFEIDKVEAGQYDNILDIDVYKKVILMYRKPQLRILL